MGVDRPKVFGPRAAEVEDRMEPGLWVLKNEIIYNNNNNNNNNNLLQLG